MKIYWIICCIMACIHFVFQVHNLLKTFFPRIIGILCLLIEEKIRNLIQYSGPGGAFTGARALVFVTVVTCVVCTCVSEFFISRSRLTLGGEIEKIVERCKVRVEYRVNEVNVVRCRKIFRASDYERLCFVIDNSADVRHKMHWMKISCILCMFGCFKDFRPSESFVTDYLTGPWKNFTTDQVNQDIYPVSTYSYLATLIIVFLITDFVRYKPIIILCGLSGITTFLMIIFGKTILIFQILEFFYGLYFSTEVAYYTYIYAKVDKKHYQEVTSHTKAATLFGRSMSGIIAQLTASFHLLDYHQLNYLTVSANVFATIWAFFLPSVDRSMYFHRASISDEQSKESFDYQLTNKSSKHCCFVMPKSLLHKVKNAYALLWKDFLQAYSNYRVAKWSIWWALATCGYLQITSYIQLLWQSAVEPGDMIYNGAVDFFYAIIGAGTVFCVGKMKLNWNLLGDVTLSVFSFLEGLILVIASYNYNIWFLYGVYIVFGVIYHTMATVASFEIAKYISEDSYGLIFGVNTFFALLMQSLLTFVVVNKLMLNIRQQFFIYGNYFLILAAVYFLMGIVNIVQHYRSGETFRLWANNDENKSLSATRDASSASDVTSKSEHNGS